jgi:hypothetical protein
VEGFKACSRSPLESAAVLAGKNSIQSYLKKLGQLLKGIKVERQQKSNVSAG